jgi:GT2 family glycosyltransferase/glycosyltransferase involved in cell wall biosynthesis
MLQGCKSSHHANGVIMKTLSSRPLISVIIPTCNRADLLSRSLESLVNQSLPEDQFEVVVIDDGSSDRTGDVCREFSKRLPLRYQYEKNSGISAAKNMGIFLSRGPILLFFDDDDVADADLLKEHVKTHSLHPEETLAVLGYTTWHPSLTRTRVMTFITDIGYFLFSYGNLKDGQLLDFTYFWGGRSSCKKSLLMKHGIFNQLFRFGSEDIELGYRLSKFGLKVIYNARAISYMIRPVTYNQFCQRCIKQGKSQYHFSRMHSDPAIQNYCMMENVDDKWAYVKRSLERRMQYVKDLESTLMNHTPLSNRQVHEIDNLYWWTFNALKIKGIIEAKEQDKVTSPGEALPGDSDTIRISKNDSKCLLKRWGGGKPKIKNRGNVLIIDPFLPMFDRASGSLRLFEITKALIRMGFQLTYIARHAEHADEYVPLLQNMGVEVHAGDPMAIEGLGLYVIGAYLDVEKILQAKRYDYVILSFWHIAEYYLPAIRQYSPESHVIIDTVDIHFLREFREAEMKGDPNLLAIAEKNKERELSIYPKADRLWVVTEEDKKVIEGIVSAPIDVVPNIHKKIGWTKVYEQTSDLLFVGNFSHGPNIDAVLFFHKKIFPLIRKQLQDIRIFIVGNNPPEQIQHLNSDNFIITGYVEDLSPFLRDARISVNPLTYGAGMKGKIGEALSCGIPVVTTSIGAEGMNLKDDEDAVIADDPNEFARKVVDLYHDKVKWERLSSNGKWLVEQRWSPEAIQRRIDSSFLDAKTFHEGNVSVLLMTSNDGETLKDSISTMRSSLANPGEILVINRSSSENTARQLLELEASDHGSRHIDVISGQTGTNPVRSWNTGLSRCTCSTIVLCREPENIDSTALSSMLSFSVQCPDIDILVPWTPMFSAQQPSATLDAVPVPIPRLRPLPFMIIRSSVLKSIGGFDARFRDDHLAWYDLIVRSSLTGHQVISMEDAKASGIDIPRQQIEEIDLEKRDWGIFVEKWGIAEGNQVPLACTDIIHKEKLEPFELFCSLGYSEGSLSDATDKGHSLSRQNIYEKPIGLTSIIILCFNQIAYTRQCLQGIEKYTSAPYELILVDNGSTDGTPAYLEEYARGHSACTLILNKNNRGYAGGNNQGIAAAKGDFILLLNNDVIVTQGWLERLIAHIESDADIGMVGPVSNSVSGPQQVEHISYGESLIKMQQFAQDYSKINAGRTQTVLRLVGFCLLIKRNALNIIGGLDEDYITGNFEDDDLCLRSLIAGYKNIIAHDVFIHHYGSMTFRGNGIDYLATMEDNRKRFAGKWKDIITLNDMGYNHHLTKEFQVKKLIEWGEDGFSKGNIGTAIKIFERILKLDRTNSQALNNLGVIQWQLGDAVSAIKTFLTALTFNPKDSDALANLTQAVTETGRSDLINPALLDRLKQAHPENLDFMKLMNAQQNSAIAA